MILTDASFKREPETGKLMQSRDRVYQSEEIRNYTHCVGNRYADLEGIGVNARDNARSSYLFVHLRTLERSPPPKWI